MTDTWETYDDLDIDVIVKEEEVVIESDNETETIVEEEVVVKPKVVVEDPKVEFCRKDGYASVYCSGISGNGNKTKSAIGFVVLDNLGDVISKGMSYNGDGIRHKEIGIESFISGMNSAKRKGFDNVCVYTDYDIPSLKYIESIDYESLPCEKTFKYTLEKFNDYSFSKISRKINVVAIRLARQAIDNRREALREGFFANKQKIKNDKAFSNRFN